MVFGRKNRGSKKEETFQNFTSTRFRTAYPMPCEWKNVGSSRRKREGDREDCALKSANILRRRHRTDKTDLSIVATGLDERLSRAELRGSAILIRASDVTVCIIVAEVKYRGYIVYIGGA